MTDLAFTELLPLGPDDTPYRLLTTDGVRTVEGAGRTFLEVDPEALTLLARTAFRDIAHWLRPRTSSSCAGSSTIQRRRPTTASWRSTS